MANTYKKDIKMATNWGGDASTGWLPVDGEHVQKFIKDEISAKIGAMYKPDGSSMVLCFSTIADKEEYIRTGNESLVVDSFETVALYTVSINGETYKQNHNVIEGTTGNTIDFDFKITDNNGMTADAKAKIEFTFECNSIVKSFSNEVALVAGDWTNVSLNVDSYISTGVNHVTIKITGLTTLTTLPFGMTYNKFNLSYTPEFEYNVVQNGPTISIPYSIECSEKKYLEYYIDGRSVNSNESMEIEDALLSTTAHINISSLAPGMHTLQTRAYVKVEGGSNFYTPFDFYSFAVGGEADPSFLMHIQLDSSQKIVTEGNILSIDVSQFETVAFNWSVYDAHERRIVVCFEYDSKIISQTEITKNGDIRLLSFRPMSFGTGKSLKAYALDDNGGSLFEFNVNFDVAKTSSGIQETTDGLLLKLESRGRRNKDTDHDVWECVGNDGNTYQATFNNFAWSTLQGWDDSTESLVISNGATVDFNIQPMVVDWAKNGGTIEIDLETFDIEDENAVICECMNRIAEKSSAYFKVTATSAEFSTADGIAISTRYKDNDRLKIAFIGNKDGSHEDGNFIYIVINGVLERAALFETGDKIISSEFLKIGDPTGKCKVRLRSIRVYNKAITVDEAFNNYVIDSDDVQTLYEKNNVVKAGTTNEIGFDEVANKIPVMIFTGDMQNLYEEGQKNKDWFPFDVEYINRQDETKNFVSFNAQLKLQGTSSLGYPRKNFKLKTKDKNFNADTYAASRFELDPDSVTGNKLLRNKVTGVPLEFGDLNGMCMTFDYSGKVLKKGKYRFKNGSHKADKWTLKADFMESSSSHNVGAGRSWNEIFKNTVLTLDVANGGYQNNTYRKAALNLQGVNKQGYKEYTKDGVPYKININSDLLAGQSDYVCRTDAQKIVWAENADEVRTAVDGFPMVCFYRTSHAANDLVFMGQYNFINDKGSYEVFGFEDIEDPNDEETMIYDASYVECWEGLKNADPISLFKEYDTFYDWNQNHTAKRWEDTYKSRYPDPDDYGVEGKKWYDPSNLYELTKWLVSTRHASGETEYSGTLTIDSSFAEKINLYQYGYTDTTKENYVYASGTMEDNAANRQKKFETEKWEHFDVWKLAGYYIYLMRYGAVDQFVKNTMLFTDGNGRYDTRTDGKYRKWFFINYDNDCLFGLRNNGEIAFDWTLDRQTVDGEPDHGEESGDTNTYAMMGHESTLWNNLEEDAEFMRMVRDLDNSMNKYGLNYDNMVAEFDTNQTEKWCERIYNANERYKYIYAAKGIGDMAGKKVDNLWMLQGTRRSHRHWWIANHFNLLDAKWLSGDYKNTYVIMKINSLAGDTIHTKAGADYYYAWGTQKTIYESNMERKEGEALDFVCPTKQVQGDPVYIYAVNKMAEMDFSEIAKNVATGSFEFHIGNTNVQNTLKKLIIGSSAITANNSQLVTSSWATLSNLEYLDITNFSGVKSVPLSTYNNLHTFKAAGTSIGSFIPANGSTFDLIELPTTIATLSLEDVSFDTDNFKDHFKYTPTTNLDALKLSSNSSKGIDISYYNNLIEPWIRTIENSVQSRELYEAASIDIDNIKWNFGELSKVMLFKNFKKYCQNGNFNLRGRIDLTSCGNLSREDISEIEAIFGENCFNESMASLYVKTPDSIFITSDHESIVAGNENIFRRELYPNESSIQELNPTIHYYLVRPKKSTDTENILYDEYVNISNSPELIRQGLTFEESVGADGKEIAILRTEEKAIGSNTEVMVLVSLSMASSLKDKYSVTKMTIIDPTYARRAEISGTNSLYINKNYTYELSALTYQGQKPIGTYTVAWSLSGEGVAYVDESNTGVDGSNNLIYHIKLNSQPDTAETMTLKAVVTNANGNSVSTQMTILALNEGVIFTSISNPVAMSIAVDNGWTTNPNAMMKDDALAITSIGTAFKGYTASTFTFDEFEYFTSVEEIDSEAFKGSSIKSITLPDSITEIGSYAFMGCESLASVKTSVDGVVSKTLPNLSEVSEGCFLGCSSLSSLKLPDSVTIIRNYAFGGTGFKKALLSTEEMGSGVLLLPSSLRTFEGSAFEKVAWTTSTASNPLEILSIPLTTKFDSTKGELNVLRGKNYSKFIVEDEHTAYLVQDDVLYDKSMQTIMRYPPRKASTDEFVLPGVLNILDYAFFAVQGITSFISRDTISANGLGVGIFEKSAIQKIDLSSSKNIVEIPNYTFCDCTALIEIKLPTQGTIAKIGPHSFDGCTLITSIAIPEGVTTAGNYVIANCTSLQTLSIPESLKTLPSYFIVSCMSLEEITFPKFASTSVQWVVKGCGAKKVTLPLFDYDETTYVIYDADNNVVSTFTTETEAVAKAEEIGGRYESNTRSVKVNDVYNELFLKECTSLQEICLNAEDNCSSYSVYDGVLYKGTSILLVPNAKTSIEYKEGVRSVSVPGFSDTALQTIVLPDTIDVCMGRTFQDIFSKKVVLGHGVTSISLQMFYSSHDLQEVISYAKEFYSILEFGLAYCPKLSNLTILSTIVPSLVIKDYGSPRSGSAQVADPKLYVSYGMKSLFESDADWNRVFFTNNGGTAFTVEEFKLDDTINVTVKRNGELSDGSVHPYLVSDDATIIIPGEYTADGVYSFALSNVANNRPLYFRESIEGDDYGVVYPWYGEFDYEVEYEVPTLFGASSLRTMASASEENPTITKFEYDVLISKINQINSKISKLKE